MNYILASKSPRRRELLGKLGIRFTVDPAVGEERMCGEGPEEIVQNLAEEKAREVAARHEGEQAVVIGADTVVAVDGRILGKPRDRAEMKQMMMQLQNRAHEVYTGVAIVYETGGETACHSFVQATQVRLYPVSEAEAEVYARCSDGLDKAGGYGMQSDAAVFVEGITGDYNNVVGLPVARLYHELRALGLFVPVE